VKGHKKMQEFPRTTVGGISLPRLIIGSNWFIGASHTSKAKDNLIKTLMDKKHIEEILVTFMQAGIDAILSPPTSPAINDAIAAAEQRIGRKMIRIMTPALNLKPGGPADREPEFAIAQCQKDGAAFCLPHQVTTDALVDRRDMVIRDIEIYTKMIRQYGMTPGLSTHLPESITFTDKHNYDIETYLQIYNSAGFMMPIEADWEMRIIQQAKKPVIVIKSMAAGRILPPVALAFVWSTIRPQDMVAVGTLTPDEATELIEISRSFIDRQTPNIELQTTRSKQILES
jgi:hypothetical protein